MHCFKKIIRNHNYAKPKIKVFVFGIIGITPQLAGIGNPDPRIKQICNPCTKL